MALSAKPRFYVYALVDPRDGSTFYIGKGCGQRAYVHERKTRARREPNGPKAERITSIHADGHCVEVRFLAEKLSEPEAYRRERGLIAELGATLTNATTGTTTPLERSMAQARALLNQVKDFATWAAQRRPTEVTMYHRVVAELEKIARDGFEPTLFIPAAA